MALLQDTPASEKEEILLNVLSLIKLEVWAQGQVGRADSVTAQNWGSLAQCALKKPINYGISFWEKKSALFRELHLQGDRVCVPLDLSPQFRIRGKFKRLGRTGWHVEMLVGQVLIGGLQAFMVRF